MWGQSVFHQAVSLQLAFPSIYTFISPCLPLFTLLHRLSGWGQILHFMIWNKIPLWKCCILKSFFPWYSSFSDNVKNRFGELPDMFWGIVHLSLTQQLVWTFKLFLPLKPPQSSFSALRTTCKSAVLGITFSMTSKWGFCVGPQHSKISLNFLPKLLQNNHTQLWWDCHC